MPGDVDGREIRVGDYVERVFEVRDFTASMDHYLGITGSGPSYRVVQRTDRYLWLEDTRFGNWNSDRFRVVYKIPETTRQMSYKVFREYQKCP